MKGASYKSLLVLVAAVLILPNLILLSGCATLSKNECLNADWKSIGYEDGARGYPVTRIGAHRKSCAKHGVAPNLDQYEAGRNQGLDVWCTPRNGYKIGTNGGRYNGVCPQSLEPPFMEAINQGRAVFAYANEVKAQKKEIKKAYEELDAIDKDLQAMEAELVSDGVSPLRRRKLLQDIRKLEGDQSYFLVNIQEMEQSLEDMQANLDRMRAENPYNE